MFLTSFHLTLALQLIALTFGAWLLMYTQNMTDNKYIISKVIAYFVIVLSFVSIVCNIVHATKYWQAGYSSKACPMMMQRQQDNLARQRDGQAPLTPSPLDDGKAGGIAQQKSLKDVVPPDHMEYKA